MPLAKTKGGIKLSSKSKQSKIEKMSEYKYGEDQVPPHVKIGGAKLPPKPRHVKKPTEMTKKDRK